MRIVRVIAGMALALSVTGHGIGQNKPLACPKGQHTLQYCITGDDGFRCGKVSCEADDVPTCPKYQHVEYGPACEPSETCLVNDPTHEHWTRSCVDDMHQVTEREWIEIDLQRRMMSEEIRELKDRLRALESK